MGELSISTNFILTKEQIKHDTTIYNMVTIDNLVICQVTYHPY